MFPSFVIGGAQARFCAVANHHGSSLRHIIVAMDGRTQCLERLSDTLDVEVLDIQAYRKDRSGTVRRLRELLADRRPDVLLTHNWGSVEWALANAPPIGRRLARHVHVEDGFGPDERDRQLARRVWGRRFALRQATVVLPSKVLMNMAETVWRLDRKTLRYVPNGIDLARFMPNPAMTPPLWARPGDGPVVGTVAALRPEKNLARLLLAAALVPGIRLVIVGDGPERTALERLAHSLGLAGRVVFAGHMDNPAPAYAHMDLFALTSDTEQMPLTVLEAMASGLPVVSTAVGDVVSMVSRENAPYVVPRDELAVARAMTELASNAQRRRTVGAANLAKAARDFDQATMFAAWGDLLGAIEPALVSQ